MRVLITGVSGFLGSWFLNHFIVAGEGHDIHSMDIVPHPKGLPIDQQDMEAWLAEFDEDVDIAFHFAAPVGGRMKIEYDPMYNADAFRLDSVFFRWAVRHAKLAVYPSSSAVYPVALQGHKNPRMLNEGYQMAEGPSWSTPDELYGFSKLAGEYMAWKAHQRHGLSTLIIRPFTGYGPGQSMDYPVPSILRRALLHEDPLTVWGSGDQRRDYVYVTDIVDATMKRIEAGVDGVEVMNIASGWGVPFRDVAAAAARLAGYEPEIVNDPTKPEGVFARWGDNQRMLRYHKPEVSLPQGLKWTMDEIKVGLVVKSGPGAEVIRVS